MRDDGRWTTEGDGVYRLRSVIGLEAIIHQRVGVVKTKGRERIMFGTKVGRHNSAKVVTYPYR